jgi:hypothetical protein
MKKVKFPPEVTMVVSIFDSDTKFAENLKDIIDNIIKIAYLKGHVTSITFTPGSEDEST